MEGNEADQHSRRAIMGTNKTSNEKTEKLNSVDAMQLIFATANAPGLEHQRIDPVRAKELSKTLGAWNKPKVVTTPRGVIIEGADYLAALAVSEGKEVEVLMDRTGRANRRARREPSTLIESLERAGITNAAFKLAVWRCLGEAKENNPVEDGPRVLVDKLADPHFLKAFEALHAPYELIQARAAGPKASRVRSKIAFSAFLLAYHSNPKKVVEMYSSFLSGKVEEGGSPLGKLLHAVRTDNINTGSGRRPFMLKAAILLRAALTGDTVGRAAVDVERGQKAVQIFAHQLGNA